MGKGQRAAHAARQTTNHQHTLRTVCIALSVIDIRNDPLGQNGLKVLPLIDIQQSFQILEVIVIVSLKAEGILNMLQQKLHGALAFQRTDGKSDRSHCFRYDEANDCPTRSNATVLAVS